MEEITQLEKEIAQRMCQWRDKVLKAAASKIECHLIDVPLEDFSEEETGFERGLNTAVNELAGMMNDDSFFR